MIHRERRIAGLKNAVGVGRFIHIELRAAGTTPGLIQIDLPVTPAIVFISLPPTGRFGGECQSIQRVILIGLKEITQVWNIYLLLHQIPVVINGNTVVPVTAGRTTVIIDDRPEF